MRLRPCAKSRSGSPAGSTSARTSRPRWSTCSRAGTDVDSRTSVAMRSRCRCVSCTWRATSPSSSPPQAPTRHGASSNVEPVPRTNLGSPSSPCGTSTRCSASWTRRGCGIRCSRSSRFRRCGSEARGRCRVHGHRGTRRSQVAVASRALDRRRRSRRGGGVASGTAGGFGEALAARRARARSRPRRRVERDLGETRTARLRRVGAGASLPSLHGARVRPVARPRSDRDPGRLPPRAAGRLRLPPRDARSRPRSTGPHPRRGRLLRGHARGAAVQAGSRRAGG